MKLCIIHACDPNICGCEDSQADIKLIERKEEGCPLPPYIRPDMEKFFTNPVLIVSRLLRYGKGISTDIDSYVTLIDGKLAKEIRQKYGYLGNSPLKLIWDRCGNIKTIQSCSRKEMKKFK